MAYSSSAVSSEDSHSAFSPDYKRASEIDRMSESESVVEKRYDVSVVVGYDCLCL